MKNTYELAKANGKRNCDVVRVVDQMIKDGFTVDAEPVRLKCRRSFNGYNLSGDTLTVIEEILKVSKNNRWHVKNVTKDFYKSVIDEKQVVVFENNGVATCTSKNIADVFGKTHTNVIRSIKNASENCNPEFTAINFDYCEIIENSNGLRVNKSYYNLTRDGMVMIVMGFTGAKAYAFKEKYIAAFNAMETELMKRHAPVSGINEDKILENIQIIRQASEAQIARRDEDIEDERRKNTALDSIITEFRTNRKKVIEAPKEDTSMVSKKEVGVALRNSALLEDIIDDGFVNTFQREAIILGIDVATLLHDLAAKHRCITNSAVDGMRLVVVEDSEPARKRYIVNVKMSNLDGSTFEQAAITATGHQWLKSLYIGKSKFVEREDDK